METRCVRLDADLDPFAIGAATGLLWSHGGLTIAGAGPVTRLPVDRPGGATSAQAELARRAAIPGDEPFGGIVALAAFPFDRNLAGELVVPAVSIVREATGRRWMVVDGRLSDDEAFSLAAQAAVSMTPKAEPSQFSVRSAVTPAVWRDEIVAATIDRIRAGDFRKAVLARELAITTDEPIDISTVLHRLRRRFVTAAVFAVDGFVGASPEVLVGRNEDLVQAHPLAGTAPRSSDPVEDSRLSTALAASTKNRIEHGITIDWLLDTLLPFCSYIDAEPEPAVVSLANVHHLATRVEGRLSSPAASILELVAALHPTPAVGGDSQRAALAHIAHHEPGDRGRYAGPVGWVDGAGNGEFAVGIRSGTIDGSTASVWAGVGVVADSDPQAELDETRSKFQAMLGALLQP